MERYNFYEVSIARKPGHGFDKIWYKADDMADLARRVLPYIEKALRVHRGYEMPTDKEENLIAELEQIAGK